jgi:hemerythrin-like domain-containing protein
MIRRGLSVNGSQASGSTSPVKADRERFAASYRDIRKRLTRLVDLARDSRSDEVVSAMAGVDRQLSLHLAAEDEFLLPRFRDVNRNEAARLSAEHDSIRSLLRRAGAEAGQQVLRVETVESLSAALRTHAEREEALLYPWAESRLLPWVWGQAARRLPLQPGRSVRG